MDNQEVYDDNKQVVDNSVQSDKNGIKSIIDIIISIFFLGCAFAFSMYFGMKQAPVDEKEENISVENENIKLSIDTIKAEEFLSKFDYVLQNVYSNSSEDLIPKEKRASINLLEENVQKFKFIYYLAEREANSEDKKYNEDVNGEEVSGAYAIKYDFFKNYYRLLLGEEFNVDVLAQLDSTYVLKNEYLYGTVLTGTRDNYNLKAESYTQKDNLYFFVILIEELNSNERVEEAYRVKFELTKNNGNYTINSIVVY